MTNNNYSNSSTFLGKLNEPNSFEINGLPPQNLAAEEAVLGGILLDPDALNRVISNLNPEAFYVTPHQIIYKTFLDLHKQGKSADLMNVATFLEDNRLIEDVGGRAKLAQLVDRTVSAHNIQELADLIIEKYHRRQIINLSSELSKLGHAGHLSWPEVIKEAENKALQLAAYRKCGKNYQHAAAEAELQKITKELEEVEAIPDEFRKKLAIRTLTKQYGLKTEKEFKDLHAKWLSSANKARSYTLDEYFQLHGNKNNDWLLKGWIPENSITVLHAMGGVGKTTLVSSICQRLLTGQDWGGYEVRRGKPIKILWIQTDQGPRVTIALFDRQGMFSLAQSEKDRLHILDQWGIEDYAVLERQLEKHKYDLVIIDSLTSVSNELIYRENDQEFARPFVRIRRIAEKHNCAFLILHHSSRAGSLRGTTAIYNAADQVWKQERVNHPTDTIGNLILEKSRYRADHMTYRLEFNPDDHFWVSVGQVTGEGERETVDDVIKPGLKAICNFLSANEGIGFQNEEISQKLKIALSTVRKFLGEASSQGLINCFRGGRKKAVYYVGQLRDKILFSDERADPVDPADPEVADQAEIRSRSMVSASKNLSDPVDPQKNEKIISHSGSTGSTGSTGSAGSAGSESKALSISFGKTLPQILSGTKTVTRRLWKDSHAQNFIRYFQTGTKINAFDKDRRSPGAKCIGFLILTASPYKEKVADMPESDVAAEGFPEFTKQQFIDQFFGDGKDEVWVIRFKFESNGAIAPTQEVQLDLAGSQLNDSVPPNSDADAIAPGSQPSAIAALQPIETQCKFKENDDVVDNLNGRIGMVLYTIPPQAPDVNSWHVHVLWADGKEYKLPTHALRPFVEESAIAPQPQEEDLPNFQQAIEDAIAPICSGDYFKVIEALEAIGRGGTLGTTYLERIFNFLPIGSRYKFRATVLEECQKAIRILRERAEKAQNSDPDAEFNSLPGKMIRLPALAKRLKIEPKTLATWAKKDANKFTQLTKEQDPQGLGWHRSPDGTFFKQVQK